MIKEIGFEDRKVVETEDGEQKEVLIFIPECCREGWDSCIHVVQSNLKKKKTNIGL